MTFDNISKAACVVQGATSNSDPCPPIIGTPPTVVGLSVRPATATIQVNGKHQFVAYLVYSNATEKDVTSLTAWATSNGSIATVDTKGLATGKVVGVTTVEGEYQGMFDRSTLTVIAECFQPGLDVAIVIDRSGSMTAASPDGQTRLQKSVAAAKAFAENLVLTKDQACVISFGGIIEENAGVTTKSPDSTLHLTLSPVKPDIQAALDSIVINEPCYSNPAPGINIHRCCTGIGGGLKAAYDELKSSRAKAGSRKVVILLTDGMENICNPDPEPLATTMRAELFSIVVIALAVPDVASTNCSAGAVTTHNYLRSLTTCDLFFTAATADDLLGIYSSLSWTLCSGNKTNPCFYYMSPPSSNPPPPACVSPKLDYVGFKYWNVVQGYVDLIGVGTNGEALYDVLPGNGLYVDLVGTHEAQPVHALKQAVGVLESKTDFSLNPGRYRISLQLAGNQRSANNTPLSVKVSVGTLWTQTVTITNWKQGFTDYVWTFVVTSPTAARVRIEHLPLPADAVQTIGTILDDVKLDNLDTGESLLNDTFDTENPC